MLGYTTNETYANLVKFRDAMFARPQSSNWRNALASWTCPTDPANSDAECDPCGSNTAWGNWDHLGCLGDPLPGESFRFEVPGDGIVTNMHITDYKIEGAVPIEELCNFPQLREFDVDGGWLEGPIPGGFGTCFKELEEIDLSYNNLSGPLPPEIAENPALRHFKVEVNQAVTGGIPPEYGSIETLQWLRLGVNKMSGEIPTELSKTSARLHHITMDQNDFEGNLYPFKDHKFVNFLPQNNPKLCGMVPLGVRYAHGFNYYNTQLGLPCPEDIRAPSSSSGAKGEEVGKAE